MKVAYKIIWTTLPNKAVLVVCLSSQYEQMNERFTGKTNYNHMTKYKNYQSLNEVVNFVK